MLPIHFYLTSKNSQQPIHFFLLLHCHPSQVHILSSRGFVVSFDFELIQAISTSQPLAYPHSKIACAFHITVVTLRLEMRIERTKQPEKRINIKS